MIPLPVDPVLLHEHAYQDTGDLSYALNLDTFTDEGGYKPVLKYGLGFFNYQLALKDEIYESSWLDQARFHLYEHFTIYFLLFLIAFLIWAFMLVAQIGHLGESFFRKNKVAFKKSSKEDDFTYHHLKV